MRFGGVGGKGRHLRDEWGSQRWWLLSDWARFLVLNGGGLWSNRLLVLDGDLETKLELGLRSSIKLLVDRCVVRVKDDKCCGTVGVTFEGGFGGRWDCEEETKLFVGRGVSTRITVEERIRVSESRSSE